MKRKTVEIVLISVALALTFVLCATAGFVFTLARNKKVPVYRVETTQNKVAISFDAAWGADKTTAIMDICDSYNVKATFFLVGFWVDAYPELVAEIERRGFEIGTHSETHPQMSKLSEEQVSSELTSSTAKITALTGNKVELFRPPFGDYNNALLSVAEQKGLLTIQWSVDSLDWKGLSGAEIAVRVQKARSGDIVLCHNNSDHILEALPLIFAWAQTVNLQFVPVGELVYFEDFSIDSQGTQKKN